MRVPRRMTEDQDSCLLVAYLLYRAIGRVSFGVDIFALSWPPMSSYITGAIWPSIHERGRGVAGWAFCSRPRIRNLTLVSNSSG